MIVAQEPAQTRAAMDETVRTRWCETFRRNQPIVKAQVIPFPVLMRLTVLLSAQPSERRARHSRSSI